MYTQKPNTKHKNIKKRLNIQGFSKSNTESQTSETSEAQCYARKQKSKCKCVNQFTHDDENDDYIVLDYVNQLDLGLDELTVSLFVDLNTGF